MGDLHCFVAVEFEDDPNVAGYYYWYICGFESVSVGDCVRAPLGRHNNIQRGRVCKKIFADEYEAPYPMWGIKAVKSVEKDDVLAAETE